jgi:hypothetical protein
MTKRRAIHVGGPSLAVLLLLSVWKLACAQPSAGNGEAAATPAAGNEAAMTIAANPDTLFEAVLQGRSDAQPAVPVAGRHELMGSGDGSLHGPRIRGKIRWSNFEKQGERVCEMNLAGVIETEDGAHITFDSQGYALLADPPQWDTAGAMRFETKDERYAWLNDVLASWQGKFDPATFSATLRAFTPAKPAAATATTQ